MSKEIQRIEYFIPKNYDGRPYCIKAIIADEAFILYSEKGIKTPSENIKDPYRYRQLLEGKRWQGITIQMWEDGIIDGCGLGYWTILGGENPNEILPRHIVDFMKGQMFKGRDKDIIENVYQEVLNHWTNWNKFIFGLRDKLNKF